MPGDKSGHKKLSQRQKQKQRGGRCGGAGTQGGQADADHAATEYKPKQGLERQPGNGDIGKHKGDEHKHPLQPFQAQIPQRRGEHCQ